MIDAGLARLPLDADFPQDKYPSYQGTVGEHIELLQLGRGALQELAKHPLIQRNGSPTLFHPDLHKRNIFVSEDDPTIVTGFIDWQSTSIEPAFHYADEVPDFARCPEDASEEEVTAESLCSQAFDGVLKILAPRLAAAREVEETLLRPLRYCHRTWRDGVVPFTHELIQLQERWQELGFKEPCPIPPLSHEKLSAFQEQLTIYDKMLDVRAEIVKILGVEQDGWVSAGRWREVEEAHQNVYQAVMASMESEHDQEDMKRMWPFDSAQL